MEFLVKKARWGSNYFPLQTLTSWFGRKLESNGKRSKKAVKELLKEELLLIHKRGETISLNPHKKEEVIGLIGK